MAGQVDLVVTWELGHSCGLDIGVSPGELLQATCSSSQHGGWVATVSDPRELAEPVLLFMIQPQKLHSIIIYFVVISPSRFKGKEHRPLYLLMGRISKSY